MPDEAGLRRALELEPRDPDLWGALGDLMRGDGRTEDAHAAYEAAVAGDPANAVRQRELGILRLDLGRPADAVEPLARSVALDPGDTRALNCLGFAQERCGRYGAAIEAFRACIDLDPDHLFAHINVVYALVHCNRIAEARGALDAALGRFPGESGLVLPEALVLKGEARFEEAIARLETQAYDQDTETRLRAKHELARLLDRTGATGPAFRQFAALNREAAEALDLSPARKAIFLRYLQAYRETLTEPWIRSWRPLAAPSNGGNPAFLLGFARSGTTLLQQILSCHPAIHAADESPAIWQIEGTLRAADPDGYPAGLATLDDAEAMRLREAYWSGHREAPGWNDRDWNDRDLLVDKNPFLVPLVPLVARLFPQARLIFALRHPCDVVLSCFMHLSDWSLLAEHLFDLDDIVRLYCETMDLWQRYEGIFTLPVHRFRYEDLIADPEPAMRGLLAFLGVSWDEGVLRHHERAAQAAGARLPRHEQALEPLHRRGRLRWHRYRDRLAPYLPRLEPYCRRFGYEI